MNGYLVKGKIVLCDVLLDSDGVLHAGGPLDAGAISVIMRKNVGHHNNLI